MNAPPGQVLGNACNVATALSERSTAFKRNLDEVNELIGDCNLDDDLARMLRASHGVSWKIDGNSWMFIISQFPDVCGGTHRCT